MTTDHDRLEVLDRMAEGFNSHDLDAIMSLFTDDCVFEAPRGSEPGGRRFEGQAAARAGLGMRFATIRDVHYGEGSHFVAGERGVSEWTLTGTTVDGVRLNLRGCALWTVRADTGVVKNSFWEIV